MTSPRPPAHSVVCNGPKCRHSGPQFPEVRELLAYIGLMGLEPVPAGLFLRMHRHILCTESIPAIGQSLLCNWPLLLSLLLHGDDGSCSRRMSSGCESSLEPHLPIRNQKVSSLRLTLLVGEQCPWFPCLKHFCCTWG